MNIEKIKEMFTFQNQTEFNYDWEKIRLSDHFLKRFSERHTEKFTKNELKELLKNECSSWEFILRDKDGVEFWHRHKRQCYIFDPRNNNLVTTYVLDFNGFENDFGKKMVENLFEEFEAIKYENTSFIIELEDKTISKAIEIEHLDAEIELLEKKRNILQNDIENDIREKEKLVSEINTMGQYIVKNRNYQTYKLVTK